MLALGCAELATAARDAGLDSAQPASAGNAASERATTERHQPERTARGEPAPLGFIKDERSSDGAALERSLEATDDRDPTPCTNIERCNITKGWQA